jgi:hypothetical protein
MPPDAAVKSLSSCDRASIFGLNDLTQVGWQNLRQQGYHL